MTTYEPLFRELNAAEWAIFDRLVEPEVSSRDEVREQLKGRVVRTIDENGSLKILVHSRARVLTRYRILGEWEFEDKDGVTVYVLLHVVGGEADELEVYKHENTKPLSEIGPSRLEMFCPSLSRR